MQQKILKGQQMGNSVSIPLKTFGIEAGRSYLVKETIDGIVITEVKDKQNGVMQKTVNGVTFKCVSGGAERFFITYDVDGETKGSFKSSVEEVNEFITEKSMELTKIYEMREKIDDQNKKIIDNCRAALLKGGWE